MAAKPKNLPAVLARLRKQYPDARYELNFETPLQLLVATILAAQCTDERVNEVTSDLFVKYPDARSYADAPPERLEQDVHPTGFFRKKAARIREVCRALVERFGGRVPDTMEEMLTLPGVARKTANVVLNMAFHKPTGVIVDSHCARVSHRLGLVRNTRPEKIELELMEIVPKEDWIFFGPAMVLHGRYVCTARKPNCAGCVLADVCPKNDLDEE